MKMFNYNMYKGFASALIILGAGLVFFMLVFLSKDFSLIIEYEFLSAGGCSMSFIIFVDWMSTLFMVFVFWISGSILLYSAEYMDGDRNSGLFLILLLLFISSMSLVVFSLSMVSIMLGWDGLGLVSFLLVIYYQNPSSVSGATITALSNRVGDGFILLVVALCVDCGVWFISDIYILSSADNLLMLSACIIIAAITKSAQVPFSAWLPRAMAAPTPVSSLVHSSTLVTAGVYLLLRSSELIVKSGLCKVLLILGMITMLVASLNANFEQDLKKIVALSTLSQLGLMVISLSLGLVWITLFHLLMHAVFKALLFMCSGEVIHQVQGSQDLRFMGDLSISLPFTGALMNGCSFSLCGVPFLCGFFSKDAILEMGYSGVYSLVFMALMSFSVGLSACYSLRLALNVFVFPGSSPLSNSFEGRGGMFYSKFWLFTLVLVSGSVVGLFVEGAPVLLVLSEGEKFITLIFTFTGFYLGSYLASFNTYGFTLLPKGVPLGWISSLGYLGSLSGEVAANSMVVSGDVSWESESYLNENTPPQVMSYKLGNLSKWSLSLQYNEFSSYFSSFILTGVLLLI
nr:NADH dehydrogenase subunit 5 [Parabopyrella angulosa]